MKTLNPRRFIAVVGLLAILLLAAMIVSSLISETSISVLQAIKGVSPDKEILFDVRIPRILLAALVGAALSVSGVSFQALLRNPLADPYILGISGGAALGAVAGMLLGLEASILGISTIPLFAFVGATVTIFFVYRVASVGGVVHRHTLLLVGVIINAFFGAMVMFVTSIVDFATMNDIVIWLMGNLVPLTYGTLGVVAAYVGIGSVFLFTLTRQFNIMTLGEEPAKQLGIEVETLKRKTFIAASFVTAAAVAYSGPIGFVGLIVPHVMRLILGPDHRLLLPSALLAGAGFLVVADTVARTLIAPTEIPVGVITVLCGGPFFIFLLKRRRKGAYYA